MDAEMQQNGGLFFTKKINAHDAHLKINTNKERISNNKIHLRDQDRFKVNVENIKLKMKTNNPSLTVEDIILFILIKYSNIEKFHLIKDIKPRFYVKTTLSRDNQSIREYLNDIHENNKPTPKNWADKIGGFLHKYLLKGVVDKTINSISKLSSMITGDRYEIRDNGMFYRYAYEYIDKRILPGNLNAKHPEKFRKEPFLMTLLNPNVQIKTGYFERVHLEERIIIKPKLKSEIDANTQKINKNDMEYHVFFFYFVEVGIKEFNLY